MHDDLIACRSFIDLALKNECTETFYIYATWPRREKQKKDDGSIVAANIDYGKTWTAPHTFADDDTSKLARWKTTSCRDYFHKLVTKLNAAYPDLAKPIRMIPAGEVLYCLDQQIKAGKLPGIEALAKRDPARLPGLDEDTSLADGVNVLYADGIHLNPMPHNKPTVGVYAAAMTVFATLSGESPIGLPGSIYELDDQLDAALIEALQKTVWQVVTDEPLTGVGN
jgi:hypothetical protein